MNRTSQPAPYRFDLHAHTTRSDGADTPWELLCNAVRRGMKAVAIADHDVLPPDKIDLPDATEKDLCEAGAQQGVALLRAIEFSCETTVQDVHIVALGCDWSHPGILRQVEDIADSKVSAYAETLHRLAERGYPMTMQEVLESGPEPIDERDLQKKMIFDLMAKKGFVPTWSDAKKLVRADPYLSVERRKPDADAIIRLIHDAGGIAILAHPFLIDAQVHRQGTQMERRQFIELLIEAGLDGIESRYTYDKTTCLEKRPKEELWAEALQIAQGRLIVSGGSDYHADYKKGTQDPRELGECGLTQEEFFAVDVFARLYHQALGTVPAHE